MTPRERRLVRDSFPIIRDEAGPLSLLFYGRLFEMDPALRPMFHGDIARQGIKLMEMLAAVVNSLDQLETLTPVLHAMGQRHTAYGVVPAHYAMVEKALTWAIGQALDLDSNAEELSAWRKVINEIGTVMKDGAALVEPLPQGNQ